MQANTAVPKQWRARRTVTQSIGVDVRSVTEVQATRDEGTGGGVISDHRFFASVLWALQLGRLAAHERIFVFGRAALPANDQSFRIVGRWVRNAEGLRQHGELA